MISKRLFLLWSVSALFLGGSLPANPVEPCDVVLGSHAAVTPLPRPEKEGWMQRHQGVLDRIAEGNVDLLMIGDSITHGWENSGREVWDRYYASRNAVNLGSGGDRTEHVLWRLENGEIENIHPKLAVLMIGTNNSNGDTYTAEQIADGIEAIVCLLREKLPETKILILAIFPRGDAAQRQDAEHDATYNDQWAKNDEASRLSSALADGETVFFLDINQAFLDEDGVLTREVMPDLLHPREKGYALWAEAMEPTVAQLMGETR
ncbi:MAG: platelet-activating factor acetylhydrolase IB subunit [Opitutaceae bacterium]